MPTLTIDRVTISGLAFVALLATLTSPADAEQAAALFAPGERVVFLGDSITDAGGFIVLVDAHLQVASADDPADWAFRRA